MRSEGERLARLVEALLTLARADAGTLLDSPEEIDLARLLESALERARAQAGRMPESIALIGEPRLPGGVAVRGDAQLLSRALGNLLDNAVRHGGPRVELALEVRERSLLLRVADDGNGIPAALAPRLFERFARGDPARSGEGAGLGLAIARAIAVAHGGTLHLLDSARGACFELRPAAPPPSSRPALISWPWVRSCGSANRRPSGAS